MGFGCGRLLVSGECLEGEEGRIGIGEAVGSEVALMARGVGRGFEDWGEFFVMGLKDSFVSFDYQSTVIVPCIQLLRGSCSRAFSGAARSRDLAF